MLPEPYAIVQSHSSTTLLHKANQDVITAADRIVKIVDHQTFYNKYMSLDPNKGYGFSVGRSSKQFYLDGNWLITKPDHRNVTFRNFLELDFYENGQFYRYYTHRYDNQHNDETRAPFRMDKILKLSGYKDLTYEKMFGTVDPSYIDYISRQFYYIHEVVRNARLIDDVYFNRHASYVDFCSHYPSNAMGILPDASRMKVVEDYVEPTPDYPFAFYPDSKNCAEWFRFDTHKWIGTKWEEYLFTEKVRPFIRNKDTVTILMPAAEYTLDKGWEYCYEHRKEDPRFKLLMNSIIGKFHMNGSAYDRHPLAHLAAIIIARANNKMFNLLNAMEASGYTVLHAVVDGVIYTGDWEFGLDEKALGNLHQEVVDSAFRIKGMNQYIYHDSKTGEYVGKHGGYNVRDDGLDIEKVTSFEDMDHWCRKDYLTDLLDNEIKKGHLTELGKLQLIDGELKGAKED